MTEISRSKKGKVAVVTGASGAIGGAFARRLAGEGAVVAGIAASADEGFANRMRDLGAEDAFYVSADFAKDEDVVAAGQAVLGRFGRADILINVVGIVPRKSFLEMSMAEWRGTMAVNVDSMVLLSQCFLPGMVERGHGRILNITSGMFGAVIDGYSAYIASKGAIVGLTRAMANDFGTSGITVNCLAPALTKTARTEKEMPDGKLFEIIAHAQAIKRPAVPEDYVGAMSFLTSDDSAFMTGQTLIVDGGLLRAM